MSPEEHKALDEKVAAKVMGWKYDPASGWQMPTGFWRHDVPAYSTNGADAWEVIDKFHGQLEMIENHGTSVTVHWTILINGKSRSAQVSGETLAHAISLGALELAGAK